MVLPGRATSFTVKAVEDSGGGRALTACRGRSGLLRWLARRRGCWLARRGLGFVQFVIGEGDRFCEEDDRCRKGQFSGDGNFLILFSLLVVLCGFDEEDGSVEDGEIEELLETCCRRELVVREDLRTEEALKGEDKRGGGS
ncbi:hypothetical protein RJT34_16262 [Clitoria ternatea]|uniref:Uncharacterized protein n=1 Tax=Clitoria ternatea TaxID=43366 RepID=A0AAN9J6V5_CLITE